VEKCCPFAKKLGINGVGEGIVWRHTFADGHQRWIFKTKGEQHKVTKEKMLIPIDVEKVANINEFIERTCTVNRFEQAIDSVYKTNTASKLFGKTPSMRDCASIIEWMRNDIVKEEIDTLIANSLETKDIVPGISKKVVYMMKMNI
jgi:hypothetical protein